MIRLARWGIGSAFAAFVVAGCGGSTPASPPAPQPVQVQAANPIPLRWSRPPEDFFVHIGIPDQVRLVLSATISAEYTATPLDSRIRIAESRLRSGRFAATIVGSRPGSSGLRVTATAPGYAEASIEVPIDVRRAPSRPDLPVDYRFDHALWDQLVFDAWDCPSAAACPSSYGSGGPALEVPDRTIRVLPDPQPGVRIVTQRPDGASAFSESELSGMREAIPAAISALTGTPYIGPIVEETTDRVSSGWITIVREDFPEDVCGRAWVGAIAGRIEMGADADCDFLPLLRHEIGHALGFWHVGTNDDLMFPEQGARRLDFSPAERYHGQIAYLLGRGSPYDSIPSTSTETLPHRRDPGPPIVITCPAH